MSDRVYTNSKPAHVKVKAGGMTDCHSGGADAPFAATMNRGD